jgi:hypothetical protein
MADPVVVVRHSGAGAGLKKTPSTDFRPMAHSGKIVGFAARRFIGLFWPIRVCN